MSDSSGPSITGIHHFSPTVRDLEASAAWYEQVFSMMRIPIPMPHHEREETGYASEAWRQIGQVIPNPALQSNRCTTFWAADCRLVAEPSLDTGEDIEVTTVRADDIVAMVRSGRLRSAQMVAAVLWWLDARARISA